MGMGMAGVEVIDGYPVEAAPEVLAHLLHPAPDEGFEVAIFGAVFGRDDEPELVTVDLHAFQERSAIGAIRIGAIERAALALAGRPVALEIAQMRQCCRMATGRASCRESS